jgi:hypothetical protein
MSDNEDGLAKINIEHALKEHGRQHRTIEVLNNATVESGTIAVRTFVLVNGAAVIAMLAFLANVYEAGNLEHFSDVIHSLSLFAYGVFAAVLTAAVTYIVNYLHTAMLASNIHQWEHPYVVSTNATKRFGIAANVCHFLAVLSAGVSLVLFLAAVLSFKNALTSM